MTTPTRFFRNESYYHIFNRGVDKATIFFNTRDHQRFLDSLIFYQQELTPTRYSVSDFNPKKRSSKLKFEIVCYCLMPNHFHLLLKQTVDSGIKKGLSRLLNSYAKFINTKYGRVGPLFQGRYKSIPIISDDQLMHLARYILLNPYVDHIVDSPEKYKWSSYNEIVFTPDTPEVQGSNTSGVCKYDILSELFPKKEQFEKFITDYADLARTKKDLQKLFID